ncbi:MAG: response regulator [Syntrophorhabdaceae bacterium]|nr:response regulator [Syntrophorhabdaceae bacterium]
MATGRKFHVLVVDNGEDTVATTTSMLEQLGYSAQAETASLAGLKAFSQDPDKFDLAIVEPAMPGQTRPGLAALGSMRRGSPVTPELTGLELAVRFRRIRQGFPVLLYTGCIEPPLAEEIKAAGFAEVIPKPLGLKELDEAVRKGLRSYFPGVR